MFWIGGHLNQFKNWLDDWAQRVVVNGQYSDWGQESVLGPVLFNSHISDLEKVTMHMSSLQKTPNWEGLADTLKWKTTSHSEVDRLEGWVLGI